MATRKAAASTKKATAKKPAPKATSSQTTVRTLSAARKEPVSTNVTAMPSRIRRPAALPGNIINIILAELVGTMILTFAALFAGKETGALYVGLTLFVLVLSAGIVSGGHFNPAVSFAAWTMRRLRTALLPFYIVAQLLGGMLAVIVMNVLTNNALKLNFDHMWFGQFNWAIFGVEMIGTAVFMFGLAAIITRPSASQTKNAIGAGLSLVVGAVVATSLLATVQNSIDTSKITAIEKIPHELRVKAATLNPAVAIAATEQSDGSFTGSRAATTEKQYSRFGAEVVLATLIGAALGGNLYLLVAGRRTPTI